jgi:hypothetical protein
MMGSTQDYFLGLAVDKVNEIRIKHMVDPYNHDVYLLVLNFKMGLLELERKEPSMISREVNTYYEAKTFYVPDGRPVAGVDLRNTLYWNPAVKTGASGKATLTFYTSDEQSLMKIIAEGIGTRGQVLAGKAAYEVK